MICQKETSCICFEVSLLYTIRSAIITFLQAHRLMLLLFQFIHRVGELGANMARQVFSSKEIHNYESDTGRESPNTSGCGD